MSRFFFQRCEQIYAVDFEKFILQIKITPRSECRYICAQRAYGEKVLGTLKRNVFVSSTQREKQKEKPYNSIRISTLAEHRPGKNAAVQSKGRAGGARYSAR